MEEVLSRFPLLGENIFDSLKGKELFNCRKICKNWNSFIDGKKFYWIQVIETLDKEAVNEWVGRPLFSGCGGSSASVENKIYLKLLKKINIEKLREFAKLFLNEEEKSKVHVCIRGRSIIT